MRGLLASLAIALGLVLAMPPAVVHADPPKHGKVAKKAGRHGGGGKAFKRSGGRSKHAAPRRHKQHRATQQRHNKHRAAPRRSQKHRAVEPRRRAPHRAAQPHRRYRDHKRARPTVKSAPSKATTTRSRRRHQRALRHHRPGAVNAQAARRGRFAAPYAARARSHSARRARRHHYAARHAWRRGLRAAFIPWYGPVFWPYAYSDIFDFAFWPYGYEDGYWAFIYDDFIDTLFWGVAGPPEDYVDYGVAPPARARRATVHALCEQPDSGITAWPFRDIERKLDLTSEQKALLDEVREAASRAAATFKDSCPASAAYPMTPPGRLRAMTARLRATLDAVKTVRPPLTRFYDSLSDEQKERFNRIGPSKLRRSAEARAALPEDAKTCATAKAGLTNLPIEQIDEAVKPSGRQEQLLDDLADATGKAVSLLQAACPTATPLTPPGRLEAMQTRLAAMVDAAETVKPALDAFYASLSSEQKARFNRIGRDLAKSRG
jgi:hypothetical protein